MQKIAVTSNDKFVYYDTKNNELIFDDKKNVKLENLESSELDKIIKISDKKEKNINRRIYQLQHDINIKEKMDNFNKKNIKLVDMKEKFMIYPADNERLFVAGKSGCGKSSIASLYMYEYKNKFPKNDILLYSPHDNDICYHKNKFIKQNLENIDEHIDLNDISNSLVIFDDMDNLLDKQQQKKSNIYLHNLLCNGRKYGISCMILAHSLMNYHETRTILNECQRIVFFTSGSKYHVSRFLKIYGGCDNETIKYIQNVKSRWVCFSYVPNYIITENELKIL